MLYIQSDLPPLRGSGRGDRKAGNRDNPSAAATQAHAGSAFEKGACIGRATALVKTAFVADTDATCIPTPDMGTRQGQGTQGLDVTVLADIKMITCAGEAPAQVVCRQVVLRIAAVAAGGGTMDDDKIDESHEN